MLSWLIWAALYVESSDLGFQILLKVYQDRQLVTFSQSNEFLCLHNLYPKSDKYELMLLWFMNHDEQTDWPLSVCWSRWHLFYFSRLVALTSNRFRRRLIVFHWEFMQVKGDSSCLHCIQNCITVSWTMMTSQPQHWNCISWTRGVKKAEGKDNLL